MENGSNYVMRDQIRNRVRAIMMHDLRHPQLRRRCGPSPIWLLGGLLALNLLAAAMTV